MTPLTPIEFALQTPCFACGAEVGELCRKTPWSTDSHYPHFGRAGMPSARGWWLIYDAGYVTAIGKDSS